MTRREDWRACSAAIASIPAFSRHEWSWTPETGSTNDDLRAGALAAPSGPPRVLVAGHQTAGRGQRNRVWRDTPGHSLLVSWTWDLPPLGTEEAFPLPVPLLVGLAIHRALVPASGDSHPVWLKWPNDLWSDRGKLAGVLVEAECCGPRCRLVIGVGINLKTPPPNASDQAFRRTSCADEGLPSDGTFLLPRILAEWASIAESHPGPAGEATRPTGGRKCALAAMDGGSKRQFRASQGCRPARCGKCALAATDGGSKRQFGASQGCQLLLEEYQRRAGRFIGRRVRILAENLPEREGQVIGVTPEGNLLLGEGNVRFEIGYDAARVELLP